MRMVKKSDNQCLQTDLNLVRNLQVTIERFLSTRLTDYTHHRQYFLTKFFSTENKSQCPNFKCRWCHFQEMDARQMRAWLPLMCTKFKVQPRHATLARNCLSIQLYIPGELYKKLLKILSIVH